MFRIHRYSFMDSGYNSIYYDDGGSWSNPVQQRKGFRQERTSKHKNQKVQQRRKA